MNSETMLGFKERFPISSNDAEVSIVFLNFRLTYGFYEAHLNHMYIYVERERERDRFKLLLDILI